MIELPFDDLGRRGKPTDNYFVDDHLVAWARLDAGTCADVPAFPAKTPSSGYGSHRFKGGIGVGCAPGRTLGI